MDYFGGDESDHHPCYTWPEIDRGSMPVLARNDIRAGMTVRVFCSEPGDTGEDFEVVSEVMAFSQHPEFEPSQMSMADRNVVDLRPIRGGQPHRNFLTDLGIDPISSTEQGQPYFNPYYATCPLYTVNLLK